MRKFCSVLPRWIIGGVFITPSEEDFEKITAADISGIMKEVCLSEEELKTLTEEIVMTEKRTPEISVGIVSGSGLTFTLSGWYGTPGRGKLLFRPVHRACS